MPTALYALNLVKKKWSKVTFPRSFTHDANVAVYGHTGTLVDSRIIFIGGFFGMMDEYCPETIFGFDLVSRDFAYIETFGSEKRGGIGFHSAHFLYDTKEIVVYRR